MRKNRTMRVAALLLALTLITSCLVAGTVAKYISGTSGSDTATVAKWSFSVNGSEFAVNPDTPATLTFDLFKTINDTGNTTDESDVADDKIAPGTAGSFELKIKNTSEVNAQWTVELSEANANAVPLQYSVDGSTWKDSIEELVMEDLTEIDIAMNGEASVTVYWQWGFEGGHAGQTDATDTMLGVTAQTSAPTVTITATLTAEQVD